MSHVSVTINGRVYRVGCDEGQEAAVEELGRDVDARIGTFRETFGEIGDMRLLVMVALQMGDELAEARRRLEAGERELARAREASAAEAARIGEVEARVAALVERAAERIERLTSTLNGAADEG